MKYVLRSTAAVALFETVFEINDLIPMGNLHLLPLAATSILQSLLENQCYAYRCFLAPYLYIIHFYIIIISRTLNDNFFYLQTYLCLQEEAGTTVKKLNSREALKVKEKKKETNKLQ